ncbi:MAG: sugar ABC transporter ATP-binding protein [Lachnospiraceae bacterium]|nr:sugar ABC transporter ATP-binding protein [Lachnospiraceae bacterium]
MEENNRNSEVVLSVEHMDKNFGSTRALRDVSLSIRAGEVRGLIGENGSGKSTVTSIVAGMQNADKGTMTYQGREWKPKSMIDALEHGIGMIVQESGTVPGISVAENIFLADVDKFKKGIVMNRKAMIREAQEILDEIGAEDIRAEMMTAALDIQSRKLIEIARVMRKKPKILIVDETTTALSQKGRDIIYNIMKKMSSEGRSAFFISHDMEEIMNECDALTVLRDGQIIRTFDKEEFDEDLIKKSMIGRELQGDYYRSDYDGSFGDEVVLEAQHITVHSSEPLKDFSIQLHKGEILGIGGLSQCGMHTLGKVLFGALRPQSGRALVHGQPVKDEADAMSHNVGYVSKDRDTESLVLQAPIQDNISVGGIDKFAKGGFMILPTAEKKYVNEQVKSLEVKCQNPAQYVSALSGGNKQKVVFGKWIGRGSDILILDCPTRGIDIGVKQTMYQLMTRMKKEGKSIIIISEEMAELIGMSDRIAIMKDGQLSTVMKREDKPQEADIIKYMI